MKRFLVFLFLTFSASNLFANDIITWREAASVENILGRWEGNMTVNIPDLLPGSSMDMHFAADITGGAGNSKALFSFEAIADLERFLDELVKIPELAMLGVTKDIFWVMMTTELAAVEMPAGVNLNIKRYTMGFQMSEEIDEIAMDFSQGQVFINNEGTMMKLVFNNEMSFGLGEEGINEIILYRR